MLFRKKESIIQSILDEADNLFKISINKYIIEQEKQLLLDKAIKLRSLGYDNSHNVKQVEQIEKDIKENENKLKIIYAIDYFKHKYPLYVFINKEIVDKICKKHNYEMHDISSYNGIVSDDLINLTETFKIDEKDLVYKRIYTYTYDNDVEIIHKNVYDMFKEYFIQKGGVCVNGVFFSPTNNTKYYPQNKMLIAPKNCFVENKKSNYTEGILVQPVSFDSIVYYLIAYV